MSLALCTITQQNSHEALRKTKLIFQGVTYLYRCSLFLRNMHCSRCTEGGLVLVLLDHAVEGYDHTLEWPGLGWKKTLLCF